jgi:hypothetical protein
MIIEMMFFTGLDQVSFYKTTRNGDRFLDRFYVTNDREKIATMISPLKSRLGSVENEYLLQRCSALIYSAQKIEVNDPSYMDSILESVTIDNLVLVQGFLEKLWIVKDHAAFQDRGWLTASVGSKSVMHNNTWNVRHTTSSGRYEAIRFSQEELKIARSLTSPKVEHLHLHLSLSGNPTSLVSSSLRFQRFMYFVQIARASLDVAMKIVQYCSALESFVSSSSSELTHQVAERVACLIETPGAARLECFKKIREAYGLRSRAVHGATFKDKAFDQLRSTSTYIDNVCRQLSILYLTNHEDVATKIESDENEFNSYFHGKIFCG